MAEVTYISYSARAKSTTADGIFAEAHQILDVSKNKNQQAINAEVTTELGKKVAKSDFDSFKTSNTSAIAAKADKSYVDTELKKKADAADVQNVQLALGQKVNTSDFNEHKTSSSLLINAKADKTYVNTELGKKANSADVYTKAQADSAITAKVNAAVASVYRVKGTKATIAERLPLTTVNSLTTRVTAVETKASTNASNITNLTSRVGAVESKFSGYVPTATYNALAARVAELEALLKLA